ncbi:MAG TPA: hypothetical protein VIL00_10940 [Pseudonocardiaceae bacterium]
MALLLAGCTRVVPGTAHPVTPPPADRELIAHYFRENNEAAARGPQAQQEFLRRTQHPDHPPTGCELGDLVLYLEPALSTLRPDPDWVVPGSSGVRPRGAVYVVAVTVTARQDGSVVATQIGTKHVVVLDGKTYGFTPCPRA